MAVWNDLPASCFLDVASGSLLPESPTTTLSKFHFDSVIYRYGNIRARGTTSKTALQIEFPLTNHNTTTHLRTIPLTMPSPCVADVSGGSCESKYTMTRSVEEPEKHGAFAEIETLENGYSVRNPKRHARSPASTASQYVIFRGFSGRGESEMKNTMWGVLNYGTHPLRTLAHVDLTLALP